MRKYLFLLLLLLFSGSSPLFPMPAQKIIYPEHWAYDALTALAIEQNISFFSGSPLTVRRFKAMLREINTETLSSAGSVIYDKLQDYLSSETFLSFGTDVLKLDVDVLLQPEFYLRSNHDLKWMYDNYYRLPLLSFPITFSFSPYFAAHFEGNFEQSRTAVNDPRNYTNFPTNNYSMTIPHRAYLSLGFPFSDYSGIQFRIGIGEEFVGRTHLGSVILSDTMQSITYAALTAYTPVFEYGARVLQLDVNKYFYMHVLQTRFLKRLSLTVMEGTLVNAPLELRFLNPLIIFHNLAAWSDYEDHVGEETAMDRSPHETDRTNMRVGSFFGAKLEIQLLRMMRLYGLWAFNELQTPRENDIEPDAFKSDSFAFQLGAEFAIPLSDASLTFGIEGLYTYPFVYVSRDKRWSFYKPESGNSRPEYSVPEEHRNASFKHWTGTPFGPDSIAVAIWARYTEDPWTFAGQFLFAAQGERSPLSIFDTDTYHPILTRDIEETNLRTPTGIPAYTYQINFRVTRSMGTGNWITASLNPGYIIVVNHSNERGNTEHGFEVTLSVQFIPRELHRFNISWK